MLYNYVSILDSCEPFVIAHRGFSSSLPTQVRGVTIPPANIIDPQLSEHADFLGLLSHLDKLCFGPNGMSMPSWVFYDCAVMPGGFFGFGIRAAALEPWCLEAMAVPAGYTGLVPISQFIAIPMLGGFAHGDVPDTWLTYSVESINQVSPGFAPAGILKLTLALGLRIFPIQTLYGTTQWRSHKLTTYVDLGPVELVTAYTPAHSLPRTFSFRIAIEDVHLETLLASPRVHPTAPPPNAWLDPDDRDALIRLQHEIEAGAKVHLVGQPQHYGSAIRIPIHRQHAGQAAVRKLVVGTDQRGGAA